MLHLVRHGQSTANSEGRLAGQLEFPLTDLGRAQARAAAVLLGTVVEVRSSSLSRARETAALLVPHVEATIDDRFIELDYGEADGAINAELPASFWAAWVSDLDFAPPGGESLRSCSTRVRVGLEELFGTPGEGARRRDGDVVVVSHVSPIKAAVAWALGADDAVVWRMHLSNASVTTIGWRGTTPVVHRYNHIAEGAPS
jgi:probable phosphoglycerate mutase